MSILVKAAAGLVAGVVAGALGLAFLPQVEPNAVKPRAAVGKPQFVVADSGEAKVPAVAVAAVTVEAKPPVKADAASQPLAPAIKPAPAPQAAKIEPPAATPAAKPETPKPQASQVAKADPQPPAPLASPSPSAAPEARAATPAQPVSTSGNAAAARWSVMGLVALAKGDLSCARLYLSRAAEAGDPRALVALADTYDPAMLARLGVVGAPGDAQRAKDLLVKAAAAGVLVSKDRMAALDQAPSSVR